MPVRLSLWRVGSVPMQLKSSQLLNESTLEEMIVADPSVLSADWMLIGRQEDTGFGGRIDLLAIAPDGSLVLVELKRHRTPREVVAQAIDYASWVGILTAEGISDIFERFSRGISLGTAFRERFGVELTDEMLNSSHQIVIVSAELDPSTERIVGYLSDRDIAINVLQFQIFANDNEKILSRAWLVDPSVIQSSLATNARGHKEPWNGEYYASFGGGSRSWDDARKYGFFSAGGGSWYTSTLSYLKPGARVWVRVPRIGYVGVGIVTSVPIIIDDFEIDYEGRRQKFTDLELIGSYKNPERPGEETREFLVSVNWLATVPTTSAIDELGMFGSQHSVCQPRTDKWQWTIERLRLAFGIL